jgi:thiamine-phosphate diphosphorylase
VIPIPRPCLCLVTDRRRLANGADPGSQLAQLARLARLIGDAIDAGIDLVQIREPELDARTLGRLADEASAHARRAGGHTRVLVNDRADVAFAAGADGVHLPERGLPPECARALREDWIIGRSIHDAPPADIAAHADYLLFGTVFRTASKPGAPVAGVDGLRRAAATLDTPVLAIGGITPARAEACMAVGAAGVAGIGMFLGPGSSVGAMAVQDAIVALRDACRRGMARRLPASG